MVALIPSPNETVSATTLANCNPSPSVQSSAPAATIGNIAGRRLAAITRHERNARPMNAATKTTSTVSPRLSFSIMIALLRAAMADRLVTDIVKPGFCARIGPSALSSERTIGRILLASRSGTRPATMTAC